MLDYESSLPAPSPSGFLARQGHPGYSDSFAGLALRFASHNGGNLFLAIRSAYEVLSR